jgi:ketosteroid isomerase-like protein
VTRDDVDRWLDAYVAAWRSYDRGEIAALFSGDVSYRYRPHEEPLDGRDAVVDSWLGEGELADWSRDREGTYDAEYRCVAVDGDVAVATGRSWYLTGPGGEVDEVFHNAFVMRFDEEGRCAEFTEWFMKAP